MYLSLIDAYRGGRGTGLQSALVVAEIALQRGIDWTAKELVRRQLESSYDAALEVIRNAIRQYSKGKIPFSNPNSIKAAAHLVKVGVV